MLLQCQENNLIIPRYTKYGSLNYANNLVIHLCTFHIPCLVLSGLQFAYYRMLNNHKTTVLNKSICVDKQKLSIILLFVKLLLFFCYSYIFYKEIYRGSLRKNLNRRY